MGIYIGVLHACKHTNSTSFNEEPSQSERVATGDVGTSRALIDSQFSVEELKRITAKTVQLQHFLVGNEDGQDMFAVDKL